MLSTYAPAIVFVLLGTVIGVAFSWLNYVLGPTARDRRTSSIRTSAACRRRSSRASASAISFYLIAMLFILFDIEVVFLYPVAVQLRAFGTFVLVETVVFVALLLVAFVYVWRRGALDWR